MTGQRTLRAKFFAFALFPRREMVLGEGPIKVRPQLSQIEAKLGFSLKNPYPGWMASAPVISQAERMLGMRK